MFSSKIPIPPRPGTVEYFLKSLEDRTPDLFNISTANKVL
jgi:hypothetical protein